MCLQTLSNARAALKCAIPNPKKGGKRVFKLCGGGGGAVARGGRGHSASVAGATPPAPAGSRNGGVGGRSTAQCARDGAAAALRPRRVGADA